MPTKCPNCGKPPYPIKDEQGKIIYKNLLKMDWLTLIMVIMIIFSAYAYNHDTAECRKLISDPCHYIDNQQCLNIIALERGANNESKFYPYIHN